MAGEQMQFRLRQARRIVIQFRDDPTPERAALIEKYLFDACVRSDDIGFGEEERDEIMRQFMVDRAREFLVLLRTELKVEYFYFVQMYLSSAETSVEDLDCAAKEFMDLKKACIVKDAREAHERLRQGKKDEYIYIVQMLAYEEIDLSEIDTDEESLLEDYVAAIVKSQPE